jgi:hypothetical protein
LHRDCVGLTARLDFGSRAQALAEQEEAQRQHPGAYLAREVGSSLVAAPLTGSLSAPTSVGRIARSTATGAIGDGLFGAGRAVSEGGSALDIAEGAGGGALAGSSHEAAPFSTLEQS